MEFTPNGARRSPFSNPDITTRKRLLQTSFRKAERRPCTPTLVSIAPHTSFYNSQRPYTPRPRTNQRESRASFRAQRIRCYQARITVETSDTSSRETSTSRDEICEHARVNEIAAGYSPSKENRKICRRLILRARKRTRSLFMETTAWP